VQIELGVVIGMAIVAFFAVLGGMKGITWTQVAQYCVLIVAYLIPAIAIAWTLTGIPIPQFALTFGDIVPKLNELQVELGLKEYIQPFQNKTALDVFAITLALMVGTAGLPHVIIRFYTVPSVRAARFSAGWALLFIALLYTTAPAIAVFAKYNLLTSLNGKSMEEVHNLSWVNSWEGTGLLGFEDKNADGVLQFTGDKETSEITIDRDIIVLSTPEVAGLSPFIIALVAAGGLAAALSTASGLLLAMSSAISHDIYYRIINPEASEELRVRVGRGMILVAVLIAGYFGINPPGFVAQVVAYAFGLAAASTFPIILLGIFDKRTNDKGAIAGMLIGLSFTMAYIIGVKVFDSGFWFMGISAEGIGAVGMILNLVTAFTVSRLTAPPPQEIQDLVESVRVPRGAGVASAH
jgi:cation/acetate symporter